MEFNRNYVHFDWEGLDDTEWCLLADSVNDFKQMIKDNIKPRRVTYSDDCDRPFIYADGTRKFRFAYHNPEYFFEPVFDVNKVIVTAFQLPTGAIGWLADNIQSLEYCIKNALPRHIIKSSTYEAPYPFMYTDCESSDSATCNTTVYKFAYLQSGKCFDMRNVYLKYEDWMKGKKAYLHDNLVSLKKCFYENKSNDDIIDGFGNDEEPFKMSSNDNCYKFAYIEKEA